MSTDNLSPIQFAAALAEIVYHRASQDDSIKYSDLGAEAIPLTTVPAGFETRNVYGATYYTPRGVVGQAVQKDGTLYVILRSTVLSASFGEGFGSGFSGSLDQTAPPSSNQVDPGDVANDLLLGIGVAQKTQFDDALALTQAAQQFAAANGGIPLAMTINPAIPHE
ncbi:hypothetical protein [Bradyrhizobium sp. SZCCHNS1054]|uniref:hypothetical protein n=1 Tax=Bradyrhizobium sp. SZCCHNS1054 TaxID=3057301 RepID=UPI002916D2F6|nr:hypothetical protein [Bradyrhizobium sp. SZCCHNS1054]